MIDFEQIERAAKMMTKYRLKEMVLPDGTKLVKEIHEVPMPRKARRPKQTPIQALMGPPLPANTDIPEAVLYAASGPPKNDFNRFKVSTVLPERDS